MLISMDKGTYSAEYDIRTAVQSSNLNEELG
jgi:phospholipid-transporting ATPase